MPSGKIRGMGGNWVRRQAGDREIKEKKAPPAKSSWPITNMEEKAKLGPRKHTPQIA